MSNGGHICCTECIHSAIESNMLFYFGAIYGIYSSLNMLEQAPTATMILSFYAVARGGATFMVASKPLNRYFLFHRIDPSNKR